MKKTSFFVCFAALLAATVGPVPRAAGEICNRVVAIVNSDIITLHELNKKIKEMTGLESSELKSRSGAAYYDTRKKILDLLINQKLAQEKIRELKIKVTSREVDAAVERIKIQNHLTQEELLKGLQEQGLDYEKFRENIKNDLERERLINSEVKSKIIIREEEIRGYYEEHKEEFAKTGGVHLAAIFLKFENPSIGGSVENTEQRAQEIVQRLRTGEDFAALAKEYSQGPGAQEGGDLGFFKASELDPELSKTVKALPVGGISQPIKRPAGIQIVKILEKRPGKVRSLEDVRDAIYAILYRQEVNKRFSVWIRGLREKAYTKTIL